MRWFVVITFICLGIFVSNQVHKMPFHPDEVSWFYHTEFFKVLFIDHDITSPKWQSYESYDHPQLSKYIYGVVLYAYDRTIFIKRDFLETKWGRWSFYFNNDFSYSEFEKYIYVMRYVQVLFVLGTVLILSKILIVLTKNYLLSILLPITLVYNDIFLSTMLRATSDAHMIFFVYLAFYLFIQKKQQIQVLAVFVALAISAKLTGLISIFFIPKKTALFFFILCAIWYIQNPALYINPIQNSWSYIDFRLVQSQRLQFAFSDIALITYGDRFLSIFRNAFSNNIVLLLIFLIGIYFGSKKLLLFVIIAFTFIGFYLPLDSDRYYSPLIPLVYLGKFIALSVFAKRKNPLRIARGFFQKITLWAGERK